MSQKDRSQVVGEQKLASLTEAQTAGFLGQAALPKLTDWSPLLTFSLSTVPSHPGSCTLGAQWQLRARDALLSALHSRLAGMGPWCKADNTKQILHAPLQTDSSSLTVNIKLTALTQPAVSGSLQHTGAFKFPRTSSHLSLSLLRSDQVHASRAQGHSEQ